MNSLDGRRKCLEIQGVLLVLALALFGAPALHASSKVTLVASPYEAPGLQGDIVVAVRIVPADGVRSIDLVYGYDATKLSPVGVFRTGYTQGFSLTSVLGNPGVIEIHLSGATPLAGSGEVAWIVLRSALTSNTATGLELISGSLNGGAIESRIEGATVSLRSASATLRVPEQVQAGPGTQVSIPILASSFTGGSAFDLSLSYNPSVLRAVSASRTPLTGCMTSIVNLSTPGTVSIAFYGVCTISGSGSIAQIQFDVIGPPGSRTPLNLTRGSINEGNPATVLEDGSFLSCELVDLDGDGFSTCSGDCDDARAATHPGASESCNGRDDDCNTLVDDVAFPEKVSGLEVTKDATGVTLSWTGIPGAAAYDIVRGDLDRLVSLRGDFGDSVDLCLGNAVTAPVAHDTSAAAATDSWYLVRARNCGGFGSYDEDASSQVGWRDPLLAGAAARCP